MNERIKKLRKSLNLTQQAFADKLGLKQNTIATYEMGRGEPSERTVSDICRLYDVSETWLRTGEGQMFVAKSREQEIGEFFADVVKDQGFKKNFVNMLARMTAEEWALMERKMREVLEDTP